MKFPITVTYRNLEAKIYRSQFTILNQPDNLRLIHRAVLRAVLTVIPLLTHGDTATLRLTGSGVNAVGEGWRRGGRSG